MSELSSLSVGDQLETEDVDIGTFADGEGIVRVSGLPTGLSVETRMDGGVKHFGVVGVVLSPGLFTVRVDVAESIEGVLTNIVAEQEIVVADTPDRYLKVSVSDLSPTGSGTVSGGGAIPVAISTSVAAKASKGYVFAGWLDSEGEISDVGDGIDYRSPAITYGADTQFELMELFALFVPDDEDSVVMIDPVGGTEFAFSADDVPNALREGPARRSRCRAFLRRLLLFRLRSRRFFRKTRAGTLCRDPDGAECVRRV